MEELASGRGDIRRGVIHGETPTFIQVLRTKII